MQARNPFEPPRTAVDDVAADPVPPMPRPSTIVRAFWLIVASAALAPVLFVVRGVPDSIVPTAGLMLVLVGIAWFVRAGRNWARVVYLLLFALSLLGFANVQSAWVLDGAPYVEAFCAQRALVAYAAWLLVSRPGSLWFSRRRP